MARIDWQSFHDGSSVPWPAVATMPVASESSFRFAIVPSPEKGPELK